VIKINEVFYTLTDPKGRVTQFSLALLFLAQKYCGWRGWRSSSLYAAAGGFKNSPNYAGGVVRRGWLNKFR